MLSMGPLRRPALPLFPFHTLFSLFPLPGRALDILVSFQADTEWHLNTAKRIK